LLHEPFTDGHRWDHYQEVDLGFADGRHYRTSFWRDPQERGPALVGGAGHGGCPDLTTEFVLAAVDDILQRRVVEGAFESVASR
jgi:hypothetical protein